MAWRDAILDAWAVLFPVECAGCGGPDRGLCADCARALAPRPARHSTSSGLEVWTALEYADVARRVLLAFKEQERTDVASHLAVPFAAAIAAASSQRPGATGDRADEPRRLPPARLRSRGAPGPARRIAPVARAAARRRHGEAEEPRRRREGREPARRVRGAPGRSPVARSSSSTTCSPRARPSTRRRGRSAKPAERCWGPPPWHSLRGRIRRVTPASHRTTVGRRACTTAPPGRVLSARAAAHEGWERSPWTSP